MTPKSENLHFFTLSCNFCQVSDKLSWIRMLKRFTKTRTRCPVVVYEEINAGFWKEKDPKMTEKTKNFQIFNVLKQFLSNFRGLEC